MAPSTTRSPARKPLSVPVLLLPALPCPWQAGREIEAFGFLCVFVSGPTVSVSFFIKQTSSTKGRRSTPPPRRPPPLLLAPKQVEPVTSYGKKKKKGVFLFAECKTPMMCLFPAVVVSLRIKANFSQARCLVHLGWRRLSDGLGGGAFPSPQPLSLSAGMMSNPPDTVTCRTFYSIWDFPRQSLCSGLSLSSEGLSAEVSKVPLCRASATVPVPTALSTQCRLGHPLG